MFVFHARWRTVADPGFPIGGSLTCWGGANLRYIHFSAKTYAKTKEIDPVEEVRAGGGPPGSANGVIKDLYFT